MKTKQILGIIVTGIVIIAVGITGILGNVINAKLVEEQESTMSTMESFWSMDMMEEIQLPEEEFVGLIHIEGEIMPSSEAAWTYTENTYDHDLYMDYIDQMIYAENNKGIMLYVNSPGGTVYESDELYLKLMEYKEVTGRPVWAYFASQACSGGYYIAMAADTIYANRNCWTGSIGVVISMLNCEGLYEKLGIEEINVTSGVNKAMGSSGVEVSEEQYGILQGLVDEAYNQFVGIVAEGRNLDEATVRLLADGRIYSANQALEHKLVDEIGSFEEGKAAFADEAGFEEEILYYSPNSEMSDAMSLFWGMMQQLKPQSDTEIATDIMENNGNGVLKYYAEEIR